MGGVFLISVTALRATSRGCTLGFSGCARLCHEAAGSASSFRLARRRRRWRRCVDFFQRRQFAHFGKAWTLASRLSRLPPSQDQRRNGGACSRWLLRLGHGAGAFLESALRRYLRRPVCSRFRRLRLIDGRNCARTLPSRRRSRGFARSSVSEHSELSTGGRVAAQRSCAVDAGDATERVLPSWPAAAAADCLGRPCGAFNPWAGCADFLAAALGRAFLAALQIVDQILSALIAIFRRFGQRLHDDFTQHRMNLAD